jgi:hypothetical protein
VEEGGGEKMGRGERPTRPQTRPHKPRRPPSIKPSLRLDPQRSLVPRHSSNDQRTPARAAAEAPLLLPTLPDTLRARRRMASRAARGDLPSFATSLLARHSKTASAVGAAAAAASAAAAIAAARPPPTPTAAATRPCSSSSATSDLPPASQDHSSEPGPSSRYERAVSAGLRACAQESHAYGRCAAGFLPDAAPRGACEAEFAALRRCFLRASGLGRRQEGEEASV